MTNILYAGQTVILARARLRSMEDKFMRTFSRVNNCSITLKLIPAYPTNIVSLWLPENSYFAQIDDRKVSSEIPVSQLRYFAPPSPSIELRSVAATFAKSTQVVLIESKWDISNQLLANHNL